MKLSELKARLKGVSVVLLTPFNADGSLDLEGMRGNVRWLAKKAAGRDFIFTPVGSTGEFYAMSDEECKAVIKMTVEETMGHAVIMAGAARAGTIETIKMCRYAESVGADGVQLVLPYYHIPFEEGMYQHYKLISESVSPDFGIMIYNNPGVSASWIKPPLMRKLSKIPNVVGVKENTPDIAAFYAMRKAVDPADAVVFCGIGELMFSFEALYGSPGFISTMANFAPDLAYSLYDAARTRDFEKVANIVDSLEPYRNLIVKVTTRCGPHTGIPGVPAGQVGYAYIGVAKAAMDIMGLRGGEVRLPLIGLTPQEKAELKDVLKAIRVM